MFTGIIESMGVVKKITTRGEDALLEIDTSMNLDDTKTGDSIAISGACLTVTGISDRGFIADLTVTGISDRGFIADVSAETLAKTTLKNLKRGDKVNLEKALRLDSFLGGHLVLGHVDGVGSICERLEKSNSIIHQPDREQV